MKNGKKMNAKLILHLLFVALLGPIICCSSSALAIDNPDAPDYVGNFMNQAQVFESEIQRTPYGTQDYISAYATYERFLDEALNKAYQQLMGNLDEEGKQQLQNAQRHWLKYRDAEFSFIERNWTIDNFGSSSIVSRAGYRTTIIKHRVKVLLHYLKNYLP